MLRYIFQDWNANHGSRKARFIASFFRVVQLLGKQNAFLRLLGIPLLATYELFVVWVLKVEIRHPTQIGPGLCLVGCATTVVHQSSILGANCRIGNCVTIGIKRGPQDCPTIGDNVSIGPNSVIIGAIHIGDGVVIEPGTVVLHDVKPYTVISGNPARVNATHQNSRL